MALVIDFDCIGYWLIIIDLVRLLLIWFDRVQSLYKVEYILEHRLSSNSRHLKTRKF